MQKTAPPIKAVRRFSRLVFSDKGVYGPILRRRFHGFRPDTTMAEHLKLCSIQNATHGFGLRLSTSLFVDKPRTLIGFFQFAQKPPVCRRIKLACRLGFNAYNFPSVPFGCEKLPSEARAAFRLPMRPKLHPRLQEDLYHFDCRADYRNGSITTCKLLCYLIHTLLIPLY